MSQERTTDELSRRGVLKGTAAAGTAAVAGSTPGYLEQLDEPRPAIQNDVEGRTFILEGIVSGWIGLEPDEIDGATGPPLRLVEGVENTVVWINGDGANHNFMIEDEDGDILEATEFTDEAGEFEELTFTAEPEMEEYYCDPHPAQMRGPVELIDPEETHELEVLVEDEDGDPFEAEVYLDDRHTFSNIASRPGPDEDIGIARFDLLEDGEYSLEVWTYGHERVTEEVTIDGDDEELTVAMSQLETEDPVETFELVLEEDAWRGVEPEEIADETNPTLELEADETYAVEWENAIGRRLDEGEMEPGEQLPGHNFVVAEGDDSDEWNTHVRSPFLDEDGESQTVEFVAKEEMSVYLDQSQLEAVGEITVSGDGS
ncbi:plastocyanin/azurin family copper-binding protein [Natronococcus sp. A-GB7]|uniref:cupredoxin domain-containing protein n=1 Tax=Natronococcus sp. A-GB7 TaxID=3037649 RepID=UPI00241E5B84|nr:plastocyanin/azurin family copper-binding protein [Natronococcus sp. A-GB7]MDG5820776.1 plastocyanin/azurin family copper-binding protein [Natronococcus sp. A-GB7]